MSDRRMRAALSLAAALLLAACVSPGRAPAPGSGAAAAGRGAAIVSVAVSLIGTPYHFGGADASGFDCSGLARYVYAQVGFSIPRTAAEQQHAAHPVALAALAPGDLVFFRLRSRRIDHVGIYSGAGRFIHAPRAGLAVSYADLRAGFYAQHLVSAGRFGAAPAP